MYRFDVERERDAGTISLNGIELGRHDLKLRSSPSDRESTPGWLLESQAQQPFVSEYTEAA